MNDLNALGGGRTGGFRAQGVVFDGTNDYLSRGANLTGLLNSKTFTFSGWFKFSDSGSSQTLICSRDGSGEYLQVIRLGSGGDTGKLRFIGTGTSSTVRLNIDTVSTVSLSAWHHIAASFDLADTGKRHVVIDGVASSLTVTTYSNAVINFTSATEFLVGAAEAGTPQLYADAAEVWFDTSYIDLSTGISKFFINDAPRYLGLDGSLPTGSQPILYLSRSGNVAASNFATNRGSGGGMTITGALTASSTDPRL